MNALNEVNKVISSVSYYTHRHNPEEEEWLTAERMAVSRTRSFHGSYSRINSFIFKKKTLPFVSFILGVDPTEPHPVYCAA